MRYVRERTVSSGNYKSVSIYQLTSEDSPRHRKRVRKQLSTPKQVRQDWKHAQRYATQLVNVNFGIGSYLVDLTYEQEPENREQAEKDVLNFVRRLQTLYKKKGAVFRAFWVTGGGREKDNGEGVTRFHHHLIISGGVSRDDVEDKWTSGRVKCSRVKIQQGEFGLEPRVKYMVKPAHCSPEPNAKRWHSRNLKKPVEIVNDNRYGCADIGRFSRAKNDGTMDKLINRYYRGWEAVGEVDVKPNPVTNLIEVNIKLKRRE